MPASRSVLHILFLISLISPAVTRAADGSSPYCEALLTAITSPIQLATETGSQKLQYVRLSFDESGDDFQTSTQILTDYVNVLHHIPDLRLKIVTIKFYAKRLHETLATIASPDERARIEIIENRISYNSIWVQDGSKPLAIENKTLLTPQGYRKKDENFVKYIKDEYRFRTLNYRQSTRSLTKINIQIVESELPFEGGNVIIGDYHVFIGSDLIEALMHKKRISRPQALQAYGRQFGKPIIEIGLQEYEEHFYQPMYHIDIFMAVVRDRTQPGLKNVVLLQSPKMLTNIPYPVDKKLRFINALEANHQEEELNKIETLLRQNGYDVIRIPGYFLHENKERSFSYANVVLSEQFALVPQYQFDAYDNQAYAIYRRLGYTVIPMPSSRRTIGGYGAIRCVSETYREACIEWTLPQP